MSHILLTNIGNRNITFKGQSYDQLDSGKPSFLDWSKELLDEYGQHEKDLDINIINPLVVGEDRPAKIVLFYSDQAEYSTRTNQDTIHEAEIIKRILIDQHGYHDDQIQLIRVKSMVIDNSGLLRFYRSQLRMIKKNGWEKVIVCDAGGTAQQKMALKVMCEYMLTPNTYEVMYAESNKILTQVDVNEYRSIINAEQAITLIHAGFYDGAASLLDYGPLELSHMQRDKTQKLLAYVHFRFTTNSKLAKSNSMCLKNLSQSITYYNESKLDFNLGKTPIPKDKLQVCADLLRKAKFYLNIKSYAQSILTFSQFYELLFTEVVGFEFKTNNIGDLSRPLTRDHEDNLKDLFNTPPMQAEYLQLKAKFDPNLDISLSRKSTQCTLTKYSNNSKIAKIATLLSPYIDKTIDENTKVWPINRIRNKIAHNGLYPNVESDSRYSYYPTLLHDIVTIFNFEFPDLFEQLNQLIEEQIRR